MTHSKNDLNVLCWTCIHNWWKPVSDIPDRSLSTLDFKVLRMYADTPPPNSFFMFLGLSSLDKLYPSISTSAFFTLEFSQDSEIAKIAYIFSSIKFLTWIKCSLVFNYRTFKCATVTFDFWELFPWIVECKVPWEVVLAAKMSTGIFNKLLWFAPRRFSWKFCWRSPRIIALIGLSFRRLWWFLPRCPLLGASKLRFLRVNHTCLDKGRCISPWPRSLLVVFQQFRSEKRKFLVYINIPANLK